MAGVRMDEARDAYAALSDLVRAARFELKENAEVAIKAVAKGEPVKWMGYGVRSTSDGLAYTVTPDAWDKQRFKNAALAAPRPGQVAHLLPVHNSWANTVNLAKPDDWTASSKRVTFLPDRLHR